MRARFWRLSILLCFATAGGFWYWPPQNPLQHDQRKLLQNQIYEMPISALETHFYHLDLNAGDFLEVSLKQHHIDLQLQLVGTASSERLQVDGFTSTSGTERMYFAASSTGRYQLEIRGFGHESGGYKLKGHWAPADSEQLRMAAAQRMLAQALSSPKEVRATQLKGAFAEALASKNELLIADVKIYLAQDQEAMGDLAGARKTYVQAALLYHSMGASHRAATAYSLLAKLVYSQDAKAARSYFEVAHRAAATTHDPALYARVQTEFASALYQAGAFQEALATYHDALNKLGPNDPGLRAQLLTHMARTYTISGRCDYARGYLQEALNYWDSVNDQINSASVRVELAWSWYAEKRYDRAIEILHDVLAKKDQLPTEFLPGILDRMGSVYRESRQFEPALNSFQQAMSMTTPGSLPQAHILANLAELYVAFNHPEAALASVDGAIETFEKARQKLFLANALFIKGKALSQSGQLDDSLEQQGAASVLIQQIRAQTTNPTSAYAFTTAYYKIYSRYVETLLAQGRSRNDASYQIKAFEFLESVRGMAPRAHLSHIWLSENRDLDLKAQLRRLTATISDIEFKRQEEGAALRTDQAENLLQLLEQAEQVSGRLNALESKHMVALPEHILETVQQELLERDSLLLTYYLGEKRSYVWAVSQTSCKVFELPSPDLIANQVTYYLSQITRLRQSQSPRAEALAQSLSQTLIAPLGELLVGKRLLIIKDGVLHGLPFGALPDPNAAGKTLIDQHSFAVLPSATYGLLMHRLIGSRQRPLRSAFVVADPVYNTSDPRLEAKPSTAEALDRVISRLPQTSIEAAVIKQLRPDALVLSGFEASKAKVLNQSLGAFQVAHFGVHGVLHELHPSLSHLLLSQLDQQGNPCNGVLSAYELANLHLPVELATLSGCKTAMGKDYRSEGLWSLGRDLMAAGAARVLVSLWDVEDEATAALMTAFYTALWQEGMAPATALQHAQQQMIHSKYSSPYYWAGFELQGDLFPLRPLIQENAPSQ